MTSDVQNKINAYWSGRSSAYDDYQLRPERYDADQLAWSEALAAALPAPPADVLDLGTGSGFVALLLARLGHRTTGTDLAEGMLERARAHAAALPDPPVFAPGDAVQPEFPDATFDAITHRYLMWTLREPQRALTAWRRVLRPGGVLVAIDSTWFPGGLDADAASEFGRHYDDSVRQALPLAAAQSIDATVELVRAAGFVDVAVTPLTRLLQLDRQHGVADGHQVQLQYLVRARNP